MFHKLKQFRDMRNKAKTLQHTLAEEHVTVENRGITIQFDGNQKVTSLTISPHLTPQEIEKILPDAINDGIRKVQKIMVQKMQKMGGMDQFKM